MKKPKHKQPKMKYVYHNANPYKSYESDCAIRAIAVCEGISWEQAYKNLFKIALKVKAPATTRKVIETYLSERYKTVQTKTRINDYEQPKGQAQLLLLQYPKVNTYHLIYTYDGKYYDTAPLDNKHIIIEIYTYQGGGEREL